ncbi:cilia- and flagella-associated protein 157 [Aulostomus maculatus]
MPKKMDKKKRDKKDEDKKIMSKKSPVALTDKNVSDDRERDLYLIQIRNLNTELERYRLKCDELERQRKDLNTQCGSLEREKKDIVEYLKHSVLEKEDEVDELLERLKSLQQAAEVDRDALQLEHCQQRQELQERNSELAVENMTLATRLAELEQFQEQKEQLMRNLESRERQLASQEEEHNAAIHTLEMKALLEKTRFEKEMESHVAAMGADVQHLVDQKVPEATRLALEENEEVKQRYGQLSEQAHILVEENMILRDRKSKLKVDVDILEQMLREISRQSCVRKRVVEQLTAKCQHLQVKLKDCRQELRQLTAKHDAILAELEELRRDQASATEQCCKDKAALSRLEAELQEEKRRRGRMKSIMQEAVITLRQALMEAATDQDSKVVQWKRLMENLLVVLDQHPPLRKDPSFTSSTPVNHQVNDLDPAVSRTGSLNPALSFQFQLARYRPGDLGLVPRPSQKRLLSRVGVRTSSNHLPLHRKPAAQKTSSCFNLGS